MREMKLNIHAFLPVSRANGPGLRAVVWLQGCHFLCPGCWNVDAQPFTRRWVVPVNDLLWRILSVPGLRGVTFSGGEPFAQAGALGALAETLVDAGLDVITYTGYTHERLAASSRPGWKRLLAATDLLIDGPFVLELKANLPMRGSSNQRLIFLTDRLRHDPYFKAGASQRFEVQIEQDGTLVCTGFLPPGIGRKQRPAHSGGIA
jgi:anaerobic ribonucleoside-triphosphate reductase activating protein